MEATRYMVLQGSRATGWLKWMLPLLLGTALITVLAAYRPSPRPMAPAVSAPKHAAAPHRVLITEVPYHPRPIVVPPKARSVAPVAQPAPVQKMAAPARHAVSHAGTFHWRHVRHYRRWHSHHAVRRTYVAFRWPVPNIWWIPRSED